MLRVIHHAPRRPFATRLARCLIAACLALSGCKKPPEPPASSVDSSLSSPLPASPSPTPEPLDLVTLPIDGTIALARARTLGGLGGLGSRAYATPGYRQTLAYLRAELDRLGWRTVFQAFDTDTPLGPRTYTNLIATWPTSSAPRERLLLAAHYDSPSSDLVERPASSSGIAGCAILLEIAERLRYTPALAARLTLLFFDGEEPARQISASDGLSGSRFFFHTLKENDQIENHRALLAFGAIGHHDAKWTLPTLTDTLLNDALQTFATRQKWQNLVTPLGRPSWGPHLPALQAGLPATYLNDAFYPALGTADDTPEMLNAESLRRAALAGLQLLGLPPATKTP